MAVDGVCASGRTLPVVLPFTGGPAFHRWPFLSPVALPFRGQAELEDVAGHAGILLDVVVLSGQYWLAAARSSSGTDDQGLRGMTKV